jgi:hypothetical protein
VRADEVRSFDIHQQGSVWECSQQASHGVACVQQYSDWHRVEREVARFTREIAELRTEGWQDA